MNRTITILCAISLLGIVAVSATASADLGPHNCDRTAPNQYHCKGQTDDGCVTSWKDDDSDGKVDDGTVIWNLCPTVE